MLVRVIEITARQARAKEKRVKFLANVAQDLCTSQRFVDLWDGDVVISRLRILYWKTKNSICIVSMGTRGELLTSVWEFVT